MNKNIIKTVGLKEDIIFYLQRLVYEIDGYKSLLRSILSNKYFVYNNELYVQFMREFKEINCEYNLAMQELKVMYGAELPNDILIEVDFYTHQANFFKYASTCKE